MDEFMLTIHDYMEIIASLPKAVYDALIVSHKEGRITNPSTLRALELLDTKRSEFNGRTPERVTKR